MKRILLIPLLLLLLATPSWGSGQPNIKVRLSAFRVVKNAQGKESVASGESAKPGEIIEYRAEYRNIGTATAQNLAGTLPVPTEMEYLPGSAKPASASASTDGSNFFRMPLMRKVRLAGGAISTREVPVGEYRAIRWDLKDLEPGASVTVSARMRIRANQKGPVVIKFDSIRNSKRSGGER